MPLEHNLPPLIEYPLTADEPWRPGPDNRAGPARIVTNEWDRGMPEVIYHDPTKEGKGRESPFSVAEYRPRVERRMGKGKGKEFF